MILMLLFCITFTVIITTQQEIITSVNATNDFGILAAIQHIFEDNDVIILSMKKVEPPRGNNETTVFYDESDYEESETDKDLKYLNEQDDTQSPKMKNILRWLPKKKQITEKNRKRTEKEAIQEQKNLVRAQNAARVAEIVSVIQNNHIAAEFMYKEMKRIVRDRVIIDDIREMVARIETSKTSGYKKSFIDCYKKAKVEENVEAEAKVWEQPTGNLVINVVKDSVNDGVNGY